MATKNEVKKVEAMPVTTDAIPDFLKGAGNLGNENVGIKDLTVPRLQIIQDLSPELDADNAEKFIPGCEKGMIFNTLTREAFPACRVVNVFYRMEWNVFVIRKRGGGFRGTYTVMQDAIEAVAQSDHPEDCEIIDTAVHFVLLLDEQGHPIGEAAIPMKSTQLKISRNWNSMIRMKGEDMARFAGTWKLGVVKQKKDQYTYFNFVVSPGPWVDQKTFEAARKFYEAIHSGAKDIDRSGLQDDIKEEDF